MKFMLPFLLIKKRLLLAIAVLGICISFINVYEPILAKQIFDKAFNVKSLHDIYQPAVLWLGIFLVRYLAQYVRLRLELVYRLAVIKKLRLYFFANLLKKKLAFFEKYTPAYLSAHCNNSIDDVDGMLLTKLIRCVLSACELVVVLFLMLKISVLLTICALALKGLEFYINFAFPLKELYKKQREAAAWAQKEMQGSLAAAALLKAGNKYAAEGRRYQQTTEVFLRQLAERDGFDVLRLVLTRLSVEMSYPVIIIVSAVFIYYGQISVGTVMAFILYFQKMNPLVTTVVYTVPIYKIAQGAAEELQRFAEAPAEELTGGEKLDAIHSVCFADVSFSYGDRKILQHCSFYLRAGGVNALVGYSGAGKSTIVQLLLGFIKADSGQIYINGKNIDTYNLQSLRRQMALVSQQNIILGRSLQENLLFHAEADRTDKDVEKVLQQTCVTEIINRQPKGLQTVIDAAGNNLSGGEKQRICIARELLKQASLNIFDEPTASLDAATDAVIMETLQELAKTKLVLLVTHKLANLVDVENIYVLAEGKIVEQGSHFSLLNEHGVYDKLWRNQCNVDA